MARELVNVYELHGQDLSQPRLVKDFLRLGLNAALEHDVCGLILLDSQHRLICSYMFLCHSTVGLFVTQVRTL